MVKVIEHRLIFKVSFYELCNYIYNPLRVFKCSTDYHENETEIVTRFSLN